MTNQTKLTIALLGVASVLAAGPTAARAQSADALIDKLVEKGVLTVKEGNELREETDKGFGQAYSVKSGMPEWVSALKFNGDFRGRYESFYSENEAYNERHRLRYRLRFGVTASLLEGFEVGLRLGSGDIDSYPAGGLDPISNNQSFQNNASKKGIFLDLAYARMTPWNDDVGTGSITIGKMENPFVFSDMVFDGDYTPEGIGGQFAYNLSDEHTLRLNAGAFVVDEVGASSQDPYLYGAQLRADSVWSPKVSTSVGGAALAISSEQRLANGSVPNINVGNTREADGSPEFDFVPVIGDAALTYTLDSAPLYNGAFPIRIGGDLIYNTGANSDADNYGWSAGLTLGKAGKRKTWEIGYTYKWLGANAWWEEMVDSDFGAYWKSAPANSGKAAGDYFAGTNVKGHIVKLSYSPYDFLTLSAKWFYTDLISERDLSIATDGNTRAHRVQVDAALKF